MNKRQTKMILIRSLLVLYSCLASQPPLNAQISQSEEMINIDADLPAQLKTLAHWQQRDSERLNSWLKKQPTLARTLLKEIFIDVHASTHLKLAPQFSESSLLLSTLATQLGQSELLNPICSAVPAVMPPECKNNESLKELYYLTGVHRQQEQLSLLSLPGFDSSYIDMSYNSAEPATLSQRGQLQILYIDSQYGFRELADFRSLQEALALSKQLKAQDLEVLVLLALARMAAQEQFEPSSFWSDLHLNGKGREISANFLNEVRQKIRSRPSERLQAELRLHEARLSSDPVASLQMVEIWFDRLPPGELQDEMKMKLADAWMTRSAEKPAQRLYRQLASKPGKVRLKALEQLIYQGDSQTLDQLVTNFDQQQDPATRVLSAYALAARHNCQKLFQTFKQETIREVRQGFARAISHCYISEDEQEAAFQRFQTLVSDEDQLVRLAVINKLSDLANQNQIRLKELMLGLNSPLPEQQLLGIWSAKRLAPNQAIDRVIPLLKSDSDEVSWMAMDFIIEHVTAKHLPVLQAQFPYRDLLLDATMRILTARLESAPHLIYEFQRNWKKYGEKLQPIAQQILMDALNRDTLHPTDLLPLLQSADPTLVRIAINSVPEGAPTEEIQPVIISLLTHPEGDIRTKAMSTLVPSPDTSLAIRALKINLKEPKVYLRHEALLALAKLDFESFAIELPSLIHDPANWVRKGVLKVWENQIYDATPEQRQLLWPMLADPDLEIAQEAVHLLASVGESEDWTEIRHQFKPSTPFRLKLRILEEFRTAGDEQPTDWKPLLIELLHSKEQTPIKEDVYDELWHHETGINWYPATEEELLKLRAAQNLIQSSQTPVPEILKLLQHVRLSPILLIDLENLETAPEWAQLLQTHLKQISDPELKKHLQMLIEKLK